MNLDLLPLLHKYDKALPRYTSYPTVPYWNFDTLSLEHWKQELQRAFLAEQGEMCLYVHLPFCESLCTYCACNKRITCNHGVEAPYIDAVLQEWALYRELLPSEPLLREIHLGGGTPTFFSPESLQRLLQGLMADAQIPDEHTFSVEVHPNYTSDAHLQTLRALGFNRLSLGVQDFDPAVQYIINREQSVEQTRHVMEQGRQLGYESINIDLIYGLPRQTLQSVEGTIAELETLRPDRIAFYSYAHVPWKSKGQRRYTDEDVPKAAEKLAMYHLGNHLLSQMGYESIGMDHFALPGDTLLQAYRQGRLHRNFMGYTTTNHKLVLGLGASSISDTWHAFAQNEKEVEAYQQRIAEGELPLINGHALSPRDMRLRQHILNLMCTDATVLEPDLFSGERLSSLFASLDDFQADGLLTREGYRLRVLPAGKLFIRNICSVLDDYLQPGSASTGAGTGSGALQSTSQSSDQSAAQNAQENTPQKTQDAPTFSRSI